MTDVSTTTSASFVIPRQAWLSSARWDFVFIIGPAFLTAAVVLLFQKQLAAVPILPLWAWVSFVLLVDVAHVYATLFRTYLEPQAFQKNSTLLTVIPIACWGVGAVLYSIDGLLFWRTLAYLAVFHFIRQQFGFSMLYSRAEPEAFQKFRWLDAAGIYAATVYPLLFWHTHLPRNFDWFVAGDFVALNESLVSAGFWLYTLIMLACFAKEVLLYFETRYFNAPRSLLLIGTALSWWVGIISVNSDLSFTMTNVISHGVPYIALIWLYQSTGSQHAGKQCIPTDKSGMLCRFRQLTMTHIILFIAVLCLLAYFEEGFWDGFVWREHAQVFLPFFALPQITDNQLLALLVPLLALPQSVHYILDGFIWRVKDRSSTWAA